MKLCKYYLYLLNIIGGVSLLNMYIKIASVKLPTKNTSDVKSLQIEM